MQSAADKEAWLSATWKAASAGSSGLKRCVYVGDSVNDLAAMVCADVGIIIGSNALLRRVAASAGIQLRQLHEGGILC